MLPSESSTRTLSIIKRTSAPYAPAFIATAPPTVPGMPDSCSMPISPFCTDSRATTASGVPAVHTASVSTNTGAVIGLSMRTITPSNPASGARIFVPLPSTWNGQRYSAHACSTRRSSAVSRGRATTAAGPPIRKLVNCASGTSR